MDFITVIPHFKRFEFLVNDPAYTKGGRQHPYFDVGTPHPTTPDKLFYNFFQLMLIINGRLIVGNAHTDILLSHVKNWYDPQYQCSLFFPLHPYAEDFYYTADVNKGINLYSTEKYIHWNIQADEHSTRKKLGFNQAFRSSDFMFLKQHYQSQMDKCLEIVFQTPQKYNIPEDKLFVGDNISLMEFRKYVDETNVYK